MPINDKFLQEMKQQQQHQKQQQRKHQYVLVMDLMDSALFCGLPHSKTF